jgi:hypothetical protein
MKIMMTIIGDGGGGGGCRRRDNDDDMIIVYKYHLAEKYFAWMLERNKFMTGSGC